MGPSFYWTDEDLVDSDQASTDSAGIELRAIGRIEVVAAAPSSDGEGEGREARVVLDPSLADGLQGLEPGDRLMVIFGLHRAGACELLQHPKGDQSRPRRGVFALRSPRRPNPIGVTVVDIVEVSGSVVVVRGLDALEGSPVLDLKPALTVEAL